MPSFWTPFGFVILGGFIAITLHYNLLCLSDLHPHRFRLPCRFHPLHQRKPNHRPSPHTCASSSLSPSPTAPLRSEEHTSELQSRQYLVCRLLLEKKKIQTYLI